MRLIICYPGTSQCGVQDDWCPADQREASTACDGQESETLSVFVENDRSGIVHVHFREATLAHDTTSECNKGNKSGREDSGDQGNQKGDPSNELETLHLRLDVGFGSRSSEEWIVLVVGRILSRVSSVP